MPWAWIAHAMREAHHIRGELRLHTFDPSKGLRRPVSAVCVKSTVWGVGRVGLSRRGRREPKAASFSHERTGWPSLAVASSVTTPNSGNIGRLKLQVMRLYLAKQHDLAERSTLCGIEHIHGVRQVNK
jgi:hypothetical protein